MFPKFLFRFLLPILVIPGTLCTVVFLGNVAVQADPILAVSAGPTYLTIVVGIFGDNTNTINRIDMYDPVTTVVSPLCTAVGGSAKEIREPAGLNTLMANSYILISATQQTILRNNFTITDYTISNLANTKYTYGPNTNIIYFIEDQGNGDCIYKKIDFTISNIPITLDTQASYQCMDIIHLGGMVRIFVKWGTTVLNYNYNDAVLVQGPFYIDCSTVADMTNFKIRAYQSYYLLAVGQFLMLTHASNNTHQCNFDLDTFIIYDAIVFDRWIMVSTVNQIRQYDIGTCMLMMATIVAQPFLFYPQENVLRMYMWVQGAPYLGEYLVEDRYTCPGGCTSCTAPYLLDSGNAECYRSTSPAVIPSNNIPNAEICLKYDQNVCITFCEYNCNTCDQNGQCMSCTLITSTIINGKCVTPIYSLTLLTIINLVNTFRGNMVQFAFITLDNFQLYQYHRTNYTGIFHLILDRMGEIQDLKWSILTVDQVLNLVKQSDGDYSYNYFTNYKLLQVQRNAGLMYKTTRDFCIAFLPLTFIIFLILNRLFRFIQKYKISCIIRSYYFWLHFISILVLANAPKLTFLSLNQLQLIFSLTYVHKINNIVSIFVIGFIVGLILCFYFLAEYFYGALSKCLFCNVFRIQWTLAYNFVRFSLLPLLRVAVHVLMFSDPRNQLLLLTIFEISLLLFIIVLETSKQLFKIKIFFLADACLQGSIVIINFILFFQYFGQYDQELKGQILELCLQNICYFMGFLIGISFVWGLGLEILSTVFKKQINSKQNKINKRKVKLAEEKIQNSSKRQDKQIAKLTLLKPQTKLEQQVFVRDNLIKVTPIYQEVEQNDNQDVINLHKKANTKTLKESKFNNIKRQVR